MNTTLAQAQTLRQAQSFVGRYIQATASSPDWTGRLAFVEQNRSWGNRDLIAATIKAQVSPMDRSDLVSGTAPLSEAITEILRPRTIVGHLNVMRAPNRVRLIMQTSAAQGGFVAPGQPIPASAMSFDSLGQFDGYRVAAIVSITEELARSVSPAAALMISSDIVKVLGPAFDQAFLDPSNAGITGTRPASVTSQGVSFSSSGATVAAIDADFLLMWNGVTDANVPTENLDWIMHPQTFGYLSLLRSSGSLAFPSISANGTLLGARILTSTACTDQNSPPAKFISLIDGASILVADEDRAELDISTEASLQMSDSPAAGAQNLVSLYQANLIGIRAQRYIDWRLRRTSAVATLVDVTY